MMYAGEDVQEGMRNSYLNRLREADWLSTPQDILKRGNMNKLDIDSLGKFLNFFEKALYQTNFNGYSKDAFISTAKRLRSGLGTRSACRTKDLSDEEVMSIIPQLPADTRDFYLMALCCGARSEQLYEAFNTTPIKIEAFSGFFRIDVRHLSHGTKRAMYFYFPDELKEIVLNYRNDKTHRKIKLEIINAGEGERPINVSSLRKFNVNLLRLCGVEGDVSEAIQGRAAQGVGGRHYLDLCGIQAVNQYPRVLPKLREILSICEESIPRQTTGKAFA